MKVVGLCGGSGSGKGCVSEYFKSFGIPSIDTDKIYRQLTSSDSECLRALADAFGESVIGADGGLDRVRLRALVFEGEGAEQRRDLLNRISHKYILERTDEILSVYAETGVKAALVDAPLLFESGYDKKCDLVLAVIADPEIRVNRISVRDGITKENARLRIASQIPNEELIKMCDLHIVNNGDFYELQTQCERIAEQIMNFKKR